MSLTREEVSKIAHLARLALTDDELEHYRGQLSAILEYASRLEEIELNDIEPSAHGTRQNVMRDDAFMPSLPREEALFNAAASAGGHFLIQPVLDQD